MQNVQKKSLKKHKHIFFKVMQNHARCIKLRSQSYTYNLTVMYLQVREAWLINWKSLQSQFTMGGDPRAEFIDWTLTLVIDPSAESVQEWA